MPIEIHCSSLIEGLNLSHDIGNVETGEDYIPDLFGLLLIRDDVLGFIAAIDGPLAAENVLEYVQNSDWMSDAAP